MEEGGLTHPEAGVVQGGVMSPVLGHVCLHHVLDAWFEQEVRPRMQGRCLLIRFVDDLVIGCEWEADARRMMDVLPKRFARCGLRIPPTKTAVIAFKKPTPRKATAEGNGPCDFLGLTHDWTNSRRGFWVITRRTAKKRLRRTQKLLWQGCRNHRHTPLKDQYRMLCLKLQGHYRYYGVRGNFRPREEVLQDAEKAWQYWLSRRSSSMSSEEAMQGSTVMR